MFEHDAIVEWRHDGGDFGARRCSRRHRRRFDGGAEIGASLSPQCARAIDGNAAAVDPAEAFVAATPSCRLLCLPSPAGDPGLVVERYRDDAGGRMTPDAAGQAWLSHVVLRPQVMARAGTVVDPARGYALHHRAHGACFMTAARRCDRRPPCARRR